ncbi:hypothetical protein K469DRAFT_781492 [Zopfia rhizophila CBS 207.26]|uniref:Uncharacterized protein n=1 Tax=Zopfia rhizophila CBS 207.26 TaxID=1314779 RepID=A0A6A6E167_9PEZI|nr:hypothetical protein K469DRAFT_781492 [Zopfia rhizophila CBS 207.26]
MVLLLPGLSLEEEACRRSAVINAIIAYCNIKKGGTLWVQRARGSTVRDPPAVNPLYKALEAAKVSVYKEKRPTICFVCLGNKKLPITERTQPFYTSGDLSKHFKRKHLRRVK